ALRLVRRAGHREEGCRWLLTWGSMDRGHGDRLSTPLMPSAGLCDSCGFARNLRSAKESSFLLCRRSEVDPAYPRYPRLPVASCAGYLPRQDTPKSPPESEEEPGK